MQFMRMVSSVTLSSTFFAEAAQSSFYPPDYVVSVHCQQQSFVEVCALNKNFSKYPRLRVSYRGDLMDQHWGRISAYIQLNGRGHVFAMKNADFEESVTIGGPLDVRLCRAGSLHDAESEDHSETRTCLHTEEPAGIVVWEADAVPADELDVFLYARDGARPKTWEVQVAFVNNEGHWDSLYGENYRFRFD